MQLDDERVERADRRRLDGAGHAREQDAHDDDRQADVELGDPQRARRPRLASNGWRGALRLDAGADGVGGDDEDEDDAGHERAEEEPLGGDAGDGAVEDHRQRRRETAGRASPTR